MDVLRNMNMKSASDEVSDGNEEYAVRNWIKGYPCYKVAMNMVGL